MKWAIIAVIYYLLVRGYLKIFRSSTYLDRSEGLDKAQREFDKWKNEYYLAGRE